MTRLLAVVAVVVVVLALAPGSARGATYTVDSCTNGSLSGWSHFNHGAYSSWANTCGIAGGGLSAAASAAAGSGAGWTFSAPADTEIAGFRVTRAFVLPVNRPYGTGVFVLSTQGPGQDYFAYRPNFAGESVASGPGVEVADGLRGQTTLTARVDCGGGGECTAVSHLVVHAASIDLRDDSVPSVGMVSGSLLAAGTLRGTRALSYAASDRGGGIRLEQLLVDGEVRSERWLACSFALVRPCPPAASGTFALDTTRLSDGEHDVVLSIADATLVNRASYGPATIMVDNVPAPSASSPPRIHGSAAAGATLLAEDGTWTGAAVALARRWQRQEHGGWEDIDGAAASTYVVGADDAGHRIRVRVRATNAEGATDAYSEPTALVAAPPTPTPTAEARPTATPTADPLPPPQAPAVALAEPSLVLRAAFRATGGSATSVRWGERRRITGTLLRVDGRPVAGARVTVTGRVHTLDAVPVALGAVTTDAAGGFAYVVGRGPSRTITFGHRDAGGVRTGSVTLQVVPRVSVAITRAGRVTGRVTGAPPGLRKRVEVQALRAGVWRTVATTRLRATGGAFSVRPRVAPRSVRARVRAERGWPFLTGTSLPARRRVA